MKNTMAKVSQTEARVRAYAIKDMLYALQKLGVDVHVDIKHDKYPDQPYFEVTAQVLYDV